jgi:hypothetical protein
MNAVVAQQVIWVILAASVSSAVLTAWFADRKGLNPLFWGLAGLVLFVLALAVVIVTPSEREPGSGPSAQAMPVRQPREHVKRRVWPPGRGAPRRRLTSRRWELGN